MRDFQTIKNTRITEKMRNRLRDMTCDQKGIETIHINLLWSVKVGLEKWAGKAKDALLDELNLSIKEKVFKQVLDPTEIQKKNA